MAAHKLPRNVFNALRSLGRHDSTTCPVVQSESPGLLRAVKMGLAEQLPSWLPEVEGRGCWRRTVAGDDVMNEIMAGRPGWPAKREGNPISSPSIRYVFSKSQYAALEWAAPSLADHVDWSVGAQATDGPDKNDLGVFKGERLAGGKVALTMTPRQVRYARGSAMDWSDPDEVAAGHTPKTTANVLKKVVQILDTPKAKANPKGLPPKALRQWEHVYQSAQDRGLPESGAAAQAWCAVKRGYKKRDGRWVLRKKRIASGEYPPRCSDRRRNPPPPEQSPVGLHAWGIYDPQTGEEVFFHDFSEARIRQMAATMADIAGVPVEFREYLSGPDGTWEWGPMWTATPSPPSKRVVAVGRRMRKTTNPAERRLRTPSSY